MSAVCHPASVGKELELTLGEGDGELLFVILSHIRIKLNPEFIFLHARVFLSALLLGLVMHTPFTLR